MATIKLAGGVVVNTYPPPPASFDFDKATDEERKRFGIPRFPSSDLTKRWQAMVRHMRYVEPAFKVREHPRKRLPGPKLDFGPQTSLSWSGVVVTPASGDKVQAVFGTWKVPKASLPAGAQDGIRYQAASWIGIDGAGSSTDVLQAGCDSTVLISSGVPKTEYLPFWEWYPVAAHWITNLPCAAGDEFNCLVLAPVPGAHVFFTLTNLSKAAFTSLSTTPPPGISLQGNCAEWILESPSGTDELAKYSTVVFSNCVAATVDGKAVLAKSGQVVNMIDQNNKVFSQGKILGSKGVQTSYI